MEMRGTRRRGWRFIAGGMIGSFLFAGGASASDVTVRIGAASNVLFGPVFVLYDSSNGIEEKH